MNIVREKRPLGDLTQTPGFGVLLSTIDHSPFSLFVVCVILKYLFVNAVFQDLSLKTGILELLSVCVDTQPGLIELFLNVQTTLPSDTNKVIIYV